MKGNNFITIPYSGVFSESEIDALSNYISWPYYSNYLIRTQSGSIIMGSEWGQNENNQNYGGQIKIDGWTGRVFSRAYNGWNSNWSNWKELINSEGGTINGDLNIGSGISMSASNEGGNFRIYSASNSDHCFEFDHVHADRLRLYASIDHGVGATASWSFYEDGTTTFPNNVYVNNGSLIVQGGNYIATYNGNTKLQMWADSEGGNIRIYSPDGSTLYEIDAYNNNLRWYGVVNGAYTGAIWLEPSGVLHGSFSNDYAEYRSCETIEPGRVVHECSDGTMRISMNRLEPACEIISDTYGFAIGETDKCKTPIAATGRVLAYVDNNRYDFNLGDAVCSGINGTVSKMTREEIMMYPERIIGTVSEIPEYETWGVNNVKINGRIWIRIK